MQFLALNLVYRCLTGTIFETIQWHHLLVPWKTFTRYMAQLHGVSTLKTIYHGDQRIFVAYRKTAGQLKSDISQCSSEWYFWFLVLLYRYFWELELFCLCACFFHWTCSNCWTLRKYWNPLVQQYKWQHFTCNRLIKQQCCHLYCQDQDRSRGSCPCKVPGDKVH
jgi:hypothetical protein